MPDAQMEGLTLTPRVTLEAGQTRGESNPLFFFSPFLSFSRESFSGLSWVFTTGGAGSVKYRVTYAGKGRRGRMGKRKEIK